MGQVEIKEKLIKNVKDEKIPNAICFIDQGGRGGLQLASEIGSYIVQNQNNPIIESTYIHPDLHYIYPTKIPADKKLFEKDMTGFYINEWRAFLSSSIYGSFNDWFSFTSSDNKAGSIRVGQVTTIIRSLNLKPFQSDKKVCITVSAADFRYMFDEFSMAISGFGWILASSCLGWNWNVPGIGMCLEL